MKLRFEAGQRLVVIGARIYSPSGMKRVRMAVDTGATRTVLKQELLDAMALGRADSGHAIPLLTGAGSVEVHRYTLPRFESIGQTRDGYEVLAYDLPEETGVDGFLGLDFFAQTRLTFDFRDRYITVE